MEEKGQSLTAFFRWFHGILCALLLCGGIALLGYSIWLEVSDADLVAQLKLEDDSFVELLLNMPIMGIVLGSLLIAVAILGFVTYEQGLCGIVSAIIFSTTLFMVAAALLFMAVITLKFVVNPDSQAVHDTLLRAWVGSVTDPRYEPFTCRIEELKNFACRGFDEGDCIGCTGGNDPNCSLAQQQRCPSCSITEVGKNFVLPGCYEAITDQYAALLLPLGILGPVLSGLALVDLVAVWFT